MQEIVHLRACLQEGRGPQVGEVTCGRSPHLSCNRDQMNDLPVIGYPCFAHRILGSPGGKHCKSLKRNVWRGVVSPLKAVSLDIECRILP